MFVYTSDHMACVCVCNICTLISVFSFSQRAVVLYSHTVLLSSILFTMQSSGKSYQAVIYLELSV